MTPSKLKLLSVYQVFESATGMLIQLRLDRSCEQVWLQVYEPLEAKNKKELQDVGSPTSRSVLMLLQKDYFLGQDKNLVDIERILNGVQLFNVHSVLDTELLSVTHQIEPSHTKADSSLELRPVLHQVLSHVGYPF